MRASPAPPAVSSRGPGLIYVKAWMFRAHQISHPEPCLKPIRKACKWWHPLHHK
ncbi:hypothetical protein [Synechococcus sp. PCC 7336]|uniref:hypothetical protein n=1 Tax=Synechococcus sp. PCC 7336 TaxID=195250 RepID=UPI0012EAF452|nr:hypothetical protein [Synechococcus sp. PCC 7336]